MGKTPCTNCEHCKDYPKTCRQGCEKWDKYEKEYVAKINNYRTSPENAKNEYFRDARKRAILQKQRGIYRKRG